MSTQTGTCIQRMSASYCPTVSVCIIANSNAAMAAAATAVNENKRCAQPSRCLHQTSKYIPASVKHAAAFIDQTMVIQVIGAPLYALAAFAGSKQLCLPPQQ